MKPLLENFDFKKLVQNSLDLMGSIDRDGYIQYVNDACTRIIGYESRNLVGRCYADFIHPDDLHSTRVFIQAVIQGQQEGILENRYIHKEGHIVPIMWSFIWSADDGYIYYTGRDMTVQREAESRIEESKNRYRALFESSPDILFVENKQGLITQINRHFSQAFNVSAAQIAGQTATSVLSEEAAALNEIHLQQALLGNTTRFDLYLGKEGESRIYNCIKQPILVNNEIIGVQTLARDITSVIQSYATIERQAKTLNNIFESITDGFVTLSRNWILTYVNSEASRLLQYRREELLGKNAWEIFPVEVYGDFFHQYQQCLASGESIQFEAYFAGNESWLGLKVFPNEDGLSIYFEDITEKVTYRKELEKLSLVASHTTNSVIFTDKTHRINWVNEGFTRLTGYSPEEALGKLPHELLYNPKSNFTAFDSLQNRIMAGERVFSEMLIRKKNGDDLWTNLQTFPIFDEAGEVSQFITVQADFTYQVKSRQELEKLSLVASKANNSVIIADKDYRIEWVNAAFTKLLGYSLQEVFGRMPSELLHSGKGKDERFALLEEKRRRGESISFESLCLTKNGDELWLSIENSAIFDEQGNVVGFIEVHTDITALKESELDLARSAQDLYQQNKDLQEFAYIVSHNLRAPVANLLGLTDLLPKMEKDDAQYELCLANLKQSVFNLDTVIRDMNSILNIRESKMNLVQEKVEVRTVFRQALDFLLEPLQTCGGRIHWELPEGFSVRANKAYLYSIFYNLLSNSIKYRSAERSLEVSIQLLDIPGKGKGFSFSDNGSGFDLHKVKNKVFKLYQRFHAGKPGRGIGLFLIKAHLEAMGGSVEVKSQVGSGTTFYIYLPADNLALPSSAGFRAG